jgi:hypothetical protein
MDDCVSYFGPRGDVFLRRHALVAVPDPAHVRLADAGAGGSHLVNDVGHAGGGPKPGVKAQVVEAGHHRSEAGEVRGEVAVGRLAVAATIPVVGQEPAAGHVQRAVLLRHGENSRGAVAVAVVVVAVGVAHAEAGDGREEGGAGDGRVRSENVLGGGADHVERVEPRRLVVGEGGRGGGRERVPVK